MRVALFTPFSPSLGGGSAQLRSHLRQLSDLEVEWHYLAPKEDPVPGLKCKWLGPRLTTSELLSDLSARSGFLPGSRSAVRKIVAQLHGDRYWVVGHYEGISVASELCDQEKPVHLTIHDDPFGTWRRSARYRWFQPLLYRTFPLLLRRARAIDVTSWGMRNLYRQKYGVNCFSLYLHVPELPRVGLARDPTQLTIGHIGTLYDLDPFRRFLKACRRIAEEGNRVLRVLRIGSSPEWEPLVREAPEVFAQKGDLDESAAIPLLTACDLLYAMYPPGRKYELFRKTSLPIKLSTYVQAQRPVFVHSPPDSGLARIVAAAGIGCVCSTLEEREIRGLVRKSLESSISRESFEHLRQELMGQEQIRQLRSALCGEDWQRASEGDFRV